MSTNASLPERIKAARLAQGLSREQAAQRWGFSRRSLEAWEGGSKSPAPLYREKLEKALQRTEGKAILKRLTNL